MVSVNQGISNGLDKKLKSFLIYYEDRDPTRYTERLDISCIKNDFIQEF